jgi:hypothetical protein
LDVKNCAQLPENKKSTPEEKLNDIPKRTYIKRNVEPRPDDGPVTRSKRALNETALNQIKPDLTITVQRRCWKAINVNYFAYWVYGLSNYCYEEFLPL